MVDSAAVRSRKRVALELVFWLLMPVIAMAALVVMGMNALGTVGCDGICRDAFVQASLYVLVGGLPAAFVVAIVMRIALRRSPRRTFVAPLTGVVAVTGVFLASFVLMQVGFAPMYERNERSANTMFTT